MRSAKLQFSWLAFGLALLVAVVVARFGAFADPQERRLPLLLLLLMAEFGGLIAIAGAIAGALRIRRSGFEWSVLLAVAGCAALAIGLVLMGFALWPGVMP